MAKDAYYFSHDANARNDLKIIQLRTVKGIRGYGIYFGILEILRESSGYKSPCDPRAIAYDLREPEEDINDVIFNYGLFKIEKNGSVFYSESMLNRMKKMDENRKKLSTAGQKGNAKRWGSPGDSGGDRSKVKDSKGNKPSSLRSDVAKPTKEQISRYFIELGSPQEADKFFDYFSSNGWKVGGKTPMKDWQAASRNWVRNNKKWDKNSNPLNLTPKQAQNMEALNEFSKRRNSTTGPGNLQTRACLPSGSISSDTNPA